MEFHINQKGKIERAFKSVKEQWMYNTDFNQFRSLEDINDNFSEYVNSKNNTSHSSLNSKTPLNVFMNDLDGAVRRVAPKVLEETFYHTVSRRVNNDATIRINSRIYETSQKYIGAKITVKFVPDMSRVFIYEDKDYIEIQEVDKFANASIKRNDPIFSGGEL